MDTERGDLSPRQIEAAGLTNLELRRAYFRERRTINRVRAPFATLERIGASGIGVGLVLEAPILLSFGVPVLAVAYASEQILIRENILSRDAFWAELQYRHNLGEIPLPMAA